MFKYLAFFALLIFAKFFNNASKLISIKRIRDRYERSFLKDGPSFTEQIPKAKKLLSDAGFGEVSISVAQPLGCSLVSSSQACIVDNLDSRRADIVSSAISLINQTVGVFRMRMWESLSPRYWIETVIFLPKNLVQYLGGKPDGIYTKLLQILYWILTPLFLTFRANIYQYVVELIGSF